MKTEIELFDDVIDIEIEYGWQNDSMDYEWWGHSESIEGDDYPVIESITWDESQYTQEQNDQIRDYLSQEKTIKKLDKQLCEYINRENQW